MPIQLTKGLFTNVIEGDAEVIEDQEVTIDGMLMGDLKVKSRAIVKINGMIAGNLYLAKNSKVSVDGLISKCVYNSGGNLVINGQVKGKIVKNHSF